MVADSFPCVPVLLSRQGWYKYLSKRNTWISRCKKACHCCQAQVLRCHSAVAQSLPCPQSSLTGHSLGGGSPKAQALIWAHTTLLCLHSRDRGRWWLVQSKATRPIGTPFGGGDFRPVNPLQCCALDKALVWSRPAGSICSNRVGAVFKADH